MPDTATATPTESGPGAVTSELAHAVPQDDAIWEKHFGKEAKEPKESRSGKDSSTRPPRDSRSSSASTSSERDGGKDGKEARSSKESSASDKNSKRESSDASKGKDKTPGKSETRSSKEDSTDAAGGKTAEADADKEPADPEATSKKARDLFEAAEKAEDPKEARKLFKRAMKEAFGKVPDEFSDARFAAARTREKAANAAAEAKSKDADTRIQKAHEALKPAIYVMRVLEGAGIHDKLTVPLVEKAVRVIKSLRSLEDGDFTSLAEVISQAAGVDHDEAMKRFVRGVKVSPEGRQARQAAEAAQRENQQLREEMAALRRDIEASKNQQTEAQKKAEQQRQVEEHRALYLEQIEEELGDHPVLKLPRGKERVMALIIRDAKAKNSKTATMSFERAADRIVNYERKRRQETAALDDGAPTPEREERSGVRSVSRTETAEGGVRRLTPEASFEQIWQKHQANGRRR